MSRMLMLGRCLAAVLVLVGFINPIKQLNWLPGSEKSRVSPQWFSVDGSREKLPSLCERRIGTSGGDCEGSEFRSGDKCFWLQAEALTLLEARLSCKRRGRDLATLSTHAEHWAESDKLYRRFQSWTPVYLGLSVDKSGTWRWLSSGDALRWSSLYRQEDRDSPPSGGAAVLGWRRRAENLISSTNMAAWPALAGGALGVAALLVAGLAAPMPDGPRSAVFAVNVCASAAMFVTMVANVIAFCLLDELRLSFLTSAGLQLATCIVFLLLARWERVQGARGSPTTKAATADDAEAQPEFAMAVDV